MNYQFRKGFKHKVTADVAGAVCEGLEKKGKLTGEQLVEVSRPEDAPLHKEFDWDDAVAGEKWRVHQARMIINSLVVIAPETNTEVRKFYNIQMSKDDRKYESIEAVMQKVEKRDILLRSAMRELSALRKKYAALSELAKVFDAIDGLENAV